MGQAGHLGCESDSMYFVVFVCRYDLGLLFDDLRLSTLRFEFDFVGVCGTV